MAGLSLAGAGRKAGKTSGRVTCMIRSATHFTRATWILPMSKDFARKNLFRTLVPQVVVRVFSRILFLRLACVSAPLPHPECGLQDTCISISTGLESSRPTSSLTGSGKDGHRNHEQREREQPGRFGACWSAGLAGVN